MLEYIVEILKEQRKGRLTESQAEDRISEYVAYANGDGPCPIIDVFGLGPVRDPDAYEIGGEPKFKFHRVA